MKIRQLAILGTWMLTFFAPRMVLACASCVVPTGGLGPTHPQSLNVAMAIRQAMDLGILERADEERYRSLWARMPQRDFLPQGFQLLVIEDGWRHTVDPVPATRTRTRSVRIVTGRAVLQALVERRLYLENAVARGLVVIEPLPAEPAVAQAATGVRTENPGETVAKRSDASSSPSP